MREATIIKHKLNMRGIRDSSINKHAVVVQLADTYKYTQLLQQPQLQFNKRIHHVPPYEHTHTQCVTTGELEFKTSQVASSYSNNITSCLDEYI